MMMMINGEADRIELELMHSNRGTLDRGTLLTPAIRSPNGIGGRVKEQPRWNSQHE